jgi:hypothetical protein
MTSSKSSDNRILKVDTLKRVRVPKARREAILDEFERSGLSGAAFAKLHGLKGPTFSVISPDVLSLVFIAFPLWVLGGQPQKGGTQLEAQFCLHCLSAVGVRGTQRLIIAILRPAWSSLPFGCGC